MGRVVKIRKQEKTCPAQGEMKYVTEAYSESTREPDIYHLKQQGILQSQEWEFRLEKATPNKSVMIT